MRLGGGSRGVLSPTAHRGPRRRRRKAGGRGGGRSPCSGRQRPVGTGRRRDAVSPAERRERGWGALSPPRGGGWETQQRCVVLYRCGFLCIAIKGAAWHCGSSSGGLSAGQQTPPPRPTNTLVGPGAALEHWPIYGAVPLPLSSSGPGVGTATLWGIGETEAQPNAAGCRLSGMRGGGADLSYITGPPSPLTSPCQGSGWSLCQRPD